MIECLPAVLVGALLFFGLFSHASHSGFGAANVKMETPRGPNESERAEMDLRMAKYRHPVALFNLIVKNEGGN